MGNLTIRIALVHRVIFAVCEHVGAQEAGCVGGGVTVGVYETSNLGVIVARLEIVEARLRVVIITAIAERIYVRQRSAAAYYLAPGVIGITRNNAAAAVDYADNVALRVEHIIVQRIIVLHRQRLIVLVVDEVDGLAAARLPRHEAAEGSELIRRRAHGLAAANTGHIIGIAYVRAADLRRRQSASLRPRERAAVVILRGISAGVGDGITAICRQQVAPRAVAVGIIGRRASNFFALNIACGVIGVGITRSADRRRGKLPLLVIAVGRAHARRIARIEDLNQTAVAVIMAIIAMGIAGVYFTVEITLQAAKYSLSSRSHCTRSYFCNSLNPNITTNIATIS